MDIKEFYHKLGKAIYRMDGAYDVISKRNHSGVTSSMMWFLYALDDGKQHTQIEICRNWHMKKTTVNTLVKECERKGYISLKAIPGEKREMLIELTDSGLGFVSGVLKPVYEAERRVLEEYLKESDLSFVDDLCTFSEVLNQYFIKEKKDDDE